jgi:hypothetical protein
LRSSVALWDSNFTRSIIFSEDRVEPSPKQQAAKQLPLDWVLVIRNMINEIIEQISIDDGETPETLKAAKEYLAEVLDAPVSDQRIVVSVAKRYIGGGLSFVELVYYGNQGLQQHYIHEEKERSFQHPALEHWWIRRAIGETIASHPPTLKQLIAAQELCRVESDRDPTNEEIAVEMGLLNLEGAVKVYMFWQGGPDLTPAVAQKLKDAVGEVERLRLLIP